MSATDTARKPSAARLTRKLQPMPDFVRAALASRRLSGRYDERPAYQRNEYLSWINRAKRQDTKEKRVKQMLDELASGETVIATNTSSGPKVGSAVSCQRRGRSSRVVST